MSSGANDVVTQARELSAGGRLAEAERALQTALAAPGAEREPLLRALADVYMQARQFQATVEVLVALTHEVPDRLYYYAHLATVLEGVGQIDAAIGHYQRLLRRQPHLADAHYNVALLYRKARRYGDALNAYARAIELGVRDAHEVYTNVGVLQAQLRRHQEAIAAYRRALGLVPDYAPALFNLAGMLEALGQRDAALALYARIPKSDPLQGEALARTAHARRVTRADGEILGRLERAIADAGTDRSSRELLYFALGKALDDLGEYDAAFAAFAAGNDLGRFRSPPHDRRAVERGFDELIAVFSAEWLARTRTVSQARPIFICGMFRSGSTLIEQMLGAHPAVTAGGELESLPALIATALQPYPAAAASAGRADLDALGARYLTELRALFPGADRVTDKRPDNFLHLGLIGALFPHARIVYTHRAPLDNCLSVYFQPLGAGLSYSTDLDDIAHYYLQHERLMRHWQALLPAQILSVDYDALVRDPEPSLRRLLAFLDLDWDPRCLEFRHLDRPVQTASVWQVRTDLYAHASGRWRHYERYLAGIRPLFEAFNR